MAGTGLGGKVLLISCLGDELDGGLLAYDGRSVERLDRGGTTGLCLTDRGLLRLLAGTADASAPGEMLLYDARGMRERYQIAELGDPHDVAWDGKNYVVVSTSTNALLWVSPEGEIKRRWQAAGEGDAWHLNSLWLRDGKLFLSAFGKFRDDRGWLGKAADRTGFVMNFATGEDLVTGLIYPHNPRFFDGTWTICNSGTREVWQLNPTGTAIRHSILFNGWTRGFALADDIFFVGESAHRGDPNPGAAASVAVVSRRDWQVIHRFALPGREVYDLLLVPPELVEGVRLATRVSPGRVGDADPATGFAQIRH